MSETPEADLPQGSLAGLRVLEASSMLAAPMTGMFLADHGAEVIKVEMPGGGDQMREWGYRRDGLGLFWKMISRNKRLVTLDLRTDEGRDALLGLLADTDVFIESFRPGTLDRWGLGIDVLQAARPDLIVLRISGFGQTGPDSAKPGFGTLAEAMSGFAQINGWADKPPSLPPFGLADAIAGITGAFGVMAAVRHRSETGEGQEIDLALYEGLLTVLGSMIVDYDQAGAVATRTGNVTPFTAPRGAYPTADGRWLAISASAQNAAHRLFRAIGHPEFIDDPRFATNADRLVHTEVLDAAISAWSSQLTLDEVLKECAEHDVTAIDIKNVADIVADEHVRARGSLVEVEDPDFGQVLMQAPVPRMTRTPGRIRFTGRPAGFDNEAILGVPANDPAEHA